MGQVPFRLTRMMINAMEVSGVEGNFRRAWRLLLSSALQQEVATHSRQIFSSAAEVSGVLMIAFKGIWASLALCA